MGGKKKHTGWKGWGGEEHLAWKKKLYKKIMLGFAVRVKVIKS
jgi:hypothetical protein